MPRATPTPAAADDGSSTAAAPEPSMTSVSMDVVTDPSPVNTESAGVEDAESSQGGKPAQPEPGKDLTAEEEALLAASFVSLFFVSFLQLAQHGFIYFHRYTAS